MRVSPITCYRPEPKEAATFAALPYDVFNRAEAAAYVAEHPGSFLAIDRPETAFGPEQASSFARRPMTGPCSRTRPPASTSTVWSRAPASRLAWWPPAP